MLKFKTFVVILVLAIAAISIPAYAQYDTEIVEPIIEGDKEVYGIDVVASEKIVLYPRSCGSVLSVTIEAANKIEGEIIINAIEVKDAPDADDFANVYEVCEIELVDIDVDDFESVDVDFKVTKSWMEDNEVKSSAVALYSYDDDKSNWDKEDTNEKSENSIYQYFNAEASNMTYWAVATSDSGFSVGNTGWILGICLFAIFIVIMLMVFIALKKRNEEPEPVYSN